MRFLPGVLSFSMVPLGFTLPKLTLLSVAIRQAVVSKKGAALLLVMSLLCWTSIDPLSSLFGRYDSWAYGLWPFAIYLFLIGTDTGWLKWLGVILSAHSVLQVFGLDPFIPSSVLPRGRAVASIGSPVDLGAILGACFVASPLPFKPACAVGLILSGSRGGMLGALAGTLYSFGRKKLALAVVAAALALTVAKDPARREIFKTAGKVFAANQILGSGPDTFLLSFRKHRTEEFNRVMGKTTAIQAHAHNDVLNWLATTGVVGTAAYLVFLLGLTWSGPFVALLTAAQFNPLGFESLAVMFSCAKEDGKNIPGWPIAVGSMLICGGLWISEKRNDPCETSRAITLLNDLGAKDLPLSRKIAGNALLCHPNDPMAHYAVATIESYYGQLGQPNRARQHFDLALRLDPTFQPLIGDAGRSK